MTAQQAPAVSPTWSESAGAVLRRFLLTPEAPALVFLLALVIFFSAATGKFFTPSNIEGVFGQIAVLGIVALAVNQVVLAGEIDISVGSMLGLCAVAAGEVAIGSGGIVLPLLAGVAVGAVAGAINGALVAWGRVPAIIVSLGMLYGLRGLILIYTGGTWVTGVPSESRVLGLGSLGGVQAPILVLFGLLLIMSFANRHTTWGRNVFAVGGNRKAARLAGLPINRTRFYTFLLVGVFVGIAATVFLGRAGTVQSNTGSGLELQVVASIVVGGTSIAGGRGSSLAAVAGAVLIGVMLNGMILMKVPSIWQNVVLGSLILLAVTVDSIRRHILEDRP
jgi:ribose/xylose/arabinose/galactoside ABC-type transport system permease subunit